MPEQLLDGANVVAGLEQVGGKGVSESVAGGSLGDAAAAHGLGDGPLDARGMEVVSAIEAVKTGSRNGYRDVPVKPVLIRKATVIMP